MDNAQVSVEEAKDQPKDECSVDIDSAVPTVEIINEKGEQLPSTDQKQVSLPKDKIVTAATTNSEADRYYTYADQGGPQTPYYQQRVDGRPVYVQGAPPPGNAARMGAYRSGNYERNYSIDSEIFGESFLEQSIRNKFVQRVYTILTVQLIYTCGFIALCIYTPEIKLFVQTQFALLIVAGVVEIATLLAMTCCISARRTFPLNFILLAIFTLAFAYIMAAVSTIYKTEIVMTSMGITGAVCLVISLIACNTSWDITSCGIYLCIILLVVTIFGFIAMIVALTTGSTVMFLIYAGLIAIVFSIYLMYDTQMIMGGRRMELSPEEYILGAILLYVDIMQIFWAILTILGMTRN